MVWQVEGGGYQMMRSNKESEACVYIMYTVFPRVTTVVAKSFLLIYVQFTIRKVVPIRRTVAIM